MHEAIELMGLEFVIPDFDFPTLRVEHHEFRGRVRVRIEHGRHRPVTLALTGAVGVVERAPREERSSKIEEGGEADCRLALPSARPATGSSSTWTGR